MGKIFIADDQLGVRRLLVDTFQEDQHEVETADNGEEAVRRYISFEPDLILLDMKIPGMNGIEALRQIRRLDSNSPVAVIMMTAYGNIQNMEIAQDLEIIDYVDKPFDLFELRERVREILERIPC